ncbi:spermidine/putrescine ABC transporter permease PotB [Paraferrimonas haliotis]|uniref:Spermidine/putrescine ABC transporter permease PotB n=2 Tax=Paraferrimonas haliotis TaxID=2013866 RepID=A0AA37U0V7_9GAMM|nr:spermidine/putrescine ABC transporter permease PotB [Paraferrimonas haliotis]
MNKMRDYFKWISLSLAVIWLSLFVVIPNIMVIATSFLSRDPNSFVSLPWQLDNYLRLADPLYAHILWHSITLAGIATLLCLVFGYPAAWIITRFGPTGRAVLLFLIIVPFWTNSLIRVYALKVILGTKGLLNWALLNLGIIETPMRLMYTETAVIIGLVYILLPFMILPLYSAIEKLPTSYSEAARDLGASRWAYFKDIMLPLTTPGIIAGVLMVFLPAMGMFYLSDLLGGSKNPLIGNMIRDQILITRDWPFGSAASVTLTVIMALMLLGYYYVHKRTGRSA